MSITQPTPDETHTWQVVEACCALHPRVVPLAAALLGVAGRELFAESTYISAQALLARLGDVSPTPATEALVTAYRARAAGNLGDEDASHTLLRAVHQDQHVARAYEFVLRLTELRTLQLLRSTDDGSAAH